MTLSLDITRLEKVRTLGGKITARCPACAASGHDRSGNHLFINTKTGQFGCAAMPDDREHRREIFRLVGTRRERAPAEERRWRKGRVKLEAAEVQRNRIAYALRANRPAIIAAHQWTEAEVCADSPEQRLEWLRDPRRFLAALFDPTDILWTGETWDSGKLMHATHWRTVASWQAAPVNDVGPMVSPATWPSGIVSRSAENVATAPYTVLDFDGLDGKYPRNHAELRLHLAASLAITRWLREALEWKLAAILFTGGKSLHAWFHTPSRVALESLRDNAPALGIDAGLIGRPEHPCRLPGWAHHKTGALARVLWLQRQWPDW